jgi:RNA polymerase sigma-70 factor (ECF subfamily)
LRDSEFVEQLKLGNERAFKKLVELYKDRVYNTCLGFLHQREDAEDIAQEVFVQVWNSIGDFKGEAALTTWIYRIAVTKSLELIRYRKSQKRKSFFESMRADSIKPDEVSDGDFAHPGVALEQKERAQILFRAIGRLSENQRVAFTLHKIEGLSYKEIAEVMEKTLSAVESLMHRAKQNLQDELYEYYKHNL